METSTYTIQLLHTLPLNTEIYYYRGGNISQGLRLNTEIYYYQGGNISQSGNISLCEISPSVVINLCIQQECANNCYYSLMSKLYRIIDRRHEGGIGKASHAPIAIIVSYLMPSVLPHFYCLTLQ